MDHEMKLTAQSRVGNQRIRLAYDASQNGEKYGYKTGSFVIDPRTGHVKFGQYSHVLLESEYRELLQRAKAKGWPVV